MFPGAAAQNRILKEWNMLLVKRKTAWHLSWIPDRGRGRRSAAVLALWALTGLARGQPEPSIGVNVVLDRAATPAILAELGSYGQVLNLLPEIHGVVLRSRASALAAIRARPYVVGADQDGQAFLTGAPSTAATPIPAEPHLTNGANRWNLDAIDVTDFSTGAGVRTVPVDGEGVYVAILDTGLMFNWRDYFPEERIATQYCTGFSGGGGTGVVVAQPGTWEHATYNHGTAMTGVILGFRYQGPPGLPQIFDGVAPKATIIHFWGGNGNYFPWNSVVAHTIVHATNLKRNELGNAPLVLSMSFGTAQDALVTAALDYAIANEVVCVASAGNGGSSGMTFPARYPPVISAAAAGWVGQFPANDPTAILWILNDVPESDPGQIYIASYSSRELPGEDLDVAAPAPVVPSPFPTQPGPSVAYGFIGGTSTACPHVAGLAALMLQKNPGLRPDEIEAILEATAMPLPAGCRQLILNTGPRVFPWSELGKSVLLYPGTVCWGDDAAGAGLIQAGAALAATPRP